MTAANSATTKVKADEAKQYKGLNLGAKTEGDIITFVEGS